MSTAKSYRQIAVRALQSHYRVEAEVTPLPGEYDLNFDVVAADGSRSIFKIMRADCDPEFVRMQIAALDHVQSRGLQGATPSVIATHDGRRLVEIEGLAGERRHAWLISFLPGVLMAQIALRTVKDAASIGALLGRLSRALEDFDHPLLDRPQKWDLRQGLWIKGRMAVISDSHRRHWVSAIVQRFEHDVLDRLNRLPRTALHNDANDMNLIFVGEGHARRALGIFDFGDMTRGSKVCEAAIAMAYAMMGPGDPIARGAALAAAFHKQSPFSDEEMALLAPLTSMRLAVSVTNAVIEARERPQDAYLQISAAPAWRLLSHLEGVGGDLLVEEIRVACASPDPALTRVTEKSLLTRRQRIIPDNQKLFYDEPLWIVRGRRHFLYDADGIEYLDVYNNVPHVGHAHPHVAEAVARQMTLVNTNSRYLQDVHVEYAERLLARLPPALTRIALVNSASEANELALRLARAATGARDMIVMDHCYHGATTGAMDISPYKFKHPRSLNVKPNWVHVTTQPDLYRGPHGDDAGAYVRDTEKILGALRMSGRQIAGFISECLPSVGGQIVLPDNYLSRVYSLVREAGGVAIADDVQTALGRLGAHFWGFDQQRVAPDIAVFGKPLGNGFPLAAVAMTERVAAAFAEGPEFFSTFGGSSAACAAGSAVLDVLDDERLPENARLVGGIMLSGLHDLAKKHEIIGDVRGFGFFLGVELVSDRARRQPAAVAAARVKNGLRERHILLGVEGPDNNVLKICPPMTFDAAAADRLLTELDGLLKNVA